MGRKADCEGLTLASTGSVGSSFSRWIGARLGVVAFRWRGRIAAAFVAGDEGFMLVTTSDIGSKVCLVVIHGVCSNSRGGVHHHGWLGRRHKAGRNAFCER